MQPRMRTLLLSAAVIVLAACTPMRTIKGSASKFLTEDGTSIAFERPVADIEAAVTQLMNERGFQELKRTEVTPNNKVVFFRGTRERINRGGRRDQQPNSNFVSQDIGSWFAVRFVTEGNRTTILFLGKPTVHGVEGCGDGDRDLRDVGYTCTEVEKRSDWAGHQLMQGREETQVISTVIAQLGERFQLQ